MHIETLPKPAPIVTKTLPQINLPRPALDLKLNTNKDKPEIKIEKEEPKLIQPEIQPPKQTIKTPTY